jgi:UDP-N-acetylmuramoyl-L-alanyl-D-glutamate--2,6-diaminopimelate ligase
MEKILRKIEKLVPRWLYEFCQPFYHFKLALFGAVIYGFPAKKIKIIGVTGTKGKTTTVEIINSVLEEAGFKTAVSGTIRFKVGNKERPNKYKMSMPGRFFMQKFLSDAVKEKCDFAVVEMTSEGSKQFRHKFIYTDAFIFTNLSPEHIERHGSFEKYKKAKVQMVNNLKKKDGLLIVNSNSEHSQSFAEKHKGEVKSFSIGDIKIDSSSPISFALDGITYTSPLIGKFNVENILAAITVAKHFEVSEEKIIEGIKNLEEVRGRAQLVPNNRDIKIVVDYAHTPDSLKAIYESFKDTKIIGVLGNTGGGRDTWKRPEMARIANEYCDSIFLTDEDPYDEDPLKIVEEMAIEIDKSKLEVEMDRKEAIKKAILKAQKGDSVLITGKGTDPYIMGANGKKEPWSDFEKIEEVLQEIK